jgi:uncharacterized membrane protein (UPF0127 family)
VNVRVIHSAADREPTHLQLEQAATPWTRLLGLIGRSSLGAAQGLWISPCNSVHCCFMRFAIDVLYLDAERRVVQIRHDLRPWRFSVCWPAHSVVELAAGECRRLKIESGDCLECES